MSLSRLPLFSELTDVRYDWTTCRFDRRLAFFSFLYVRGIHSLLQFVPNLSKGALTCVSLFSFIVIPQAIDLKKSNDSWQWHLIRALRESFLLNEPKAVNPSHNREPLWVSCWLKGQIDGIFVLCVCFEGLFIPYWNSRCLFTLI